MTSSPLRAGATLEEELEYYKKQYEQLETDLADFQASSKELEEQLERDVENAEKSERKLKEQVEKVTFEAEEWKTKHKQAKAEANSAQIALQREITSIRETNRTMHLKLRDTEVMNDDYERQARHTESSLEDLESKYNVAIERGVLMEEEFKHGEQEREALRIEAQRLRDDLSDLKVENEITLEKLRLAEEIIERLRSRKPSPLAVESLRARSPGSEASGITPSTIASTPPSKSDTASEMQTPPSPPLSDAPTNTVVETRTPNLPKRRSLIPDSGLTPRPSLHGPRTQPNHTRGPSTASSSAAASDARAMKPPSSRPRIASRPSNPGSERLPRSDSLYQIRNLRGRMQKIEERVQSARSKLPAPKNSTPKTGPTLEDDLPTSVTMRRSIRRPGSNIGNQMDDSSDVASDTPSRRHSQIPLDSGIETRRSQASSRLSYGMPRPPSSAVDRPASTSDHPVPATPNANRPTSRASLAWDSAANSTHHRPSSRTSLVSGGTLLTTNRPGSRSGAPPPSTANTRHSIIATSPRSSSSVGAGAYATVHGTPRSRVHRPSASISELKWKSEDSSTSSSPTRRGTLDRTALGTMRRQSGVGVFSSQTKASGTVGSMRPPASPGKKVQAGDLGETF